MLLPHVDKTSLRLLGFQLWLKPLLLQPQKRLLLLRPQLLLLILLELCLKKPLLLLLQPQKKLLLLLKLHPLSLVFKARLLLLERVKHRSGNNANIEDAEVVR